jgi:hemolysin III
MNITAPRYSIGEEIANSITHGVGIVFSIAALGVLTAFASVFGDVWHIVSCSIFAATLILMYTASTLYHSIQLPRAKTILRIFDHSAIFLLIAGTYTPFTLVNLRGAWGWSLFGVIWGLALFGVVFQIILHLKHNADMRRWVILSLGLYVAMGWAVVVAVKPLFTAVSPKGLLLLLIGGLCYTLGIGFYIWSRLPYHHAVWHIFVLGGSISHFFAILFYVIPIGK